jgi:hypothetical protein
MGEIKQKAREMLAAEYRTHGWHEDAGRLCMGGEVTSFVEDDALRVIGRLIEQGDEDNHVITELGRLLASIAVILKGPEPAGTAWSYHDLPDMVQALTQQRGSASYDAGMAMHWIERYAAGIDEECQLDRIAEAFTTPQPSADAVRELVKRWRDQDARKHSAPGDRSDCADELESLLSAASNHQQNAAQGGGEK